jgi:bifunctional ADP-heptose synthase (sugar kinase/adenylyltransferase)
VVNTTGAGDCAIAGLIASIANGSGPEEALTMAAAAGACSVEGADASSGVRCMPELKSRIKAGWERMESSAPGADWSYDSCAGVWNYAREEEVHETK